MVDLSIVMGQGNHGIKDGLPIKNGEFPIFHGYVSHNQMVPMLKKDESQAHRRTLPQRA
jgi:hypothetical protein